MASAAQVQRFEGKGKEQITTADPSTNISLHDRYKSSTAAEAGTPPSPPPLSLLTTVQPLEHSPTPPPASLQAAPLESREEENECFDLIAALLGAGVPHIVQLIMSYLDMVSLTVCEKVSSLWREVAQELPVWKHTVMKNVETRTLWRDLFERRGWHKFLTEQVPGRVSGSINYLYRQLHQSVSRDIHSLEANWRRGHYTLTRIETDDFVQCLQYDSEKIVSAHRDNTIKVCPSKEQCHMFFGADKVAVGREELPYHKRFLPMNSAAGYQNQIWDKDTLKLLNTLTGHQASVECLQFNHDVVISGAYDRSVKVWDIQTGQMINNLPCKGYVRALKFNSELLITGSDDRTVSVWDFRSPTTITLRRVLRGDPGRIMAVDLTDTCIISGFGRPDCFIKVWDSSTGELLHTLQLSEGVECLQCRGNLIISGSVKTIQVWNMDTGDCLREWEGHESFIYCVAVDDKRIVTGGYDKTVKVWSVSAVLDPSSSTDELCTTTLNEHTSYVVTVQIDDFRIVTGSWDSNIVICDFLDPVPPHSILGN